MLLTVSASEYWYLWVEISSQQFEELKGAPLDKGSELICYYMESANNNSGCVNGECQIFLDNQDGPLETIVLDESDFSIEEVSWKGDVLLIQIIEQWGDERETYDVGDKYEPVKLDRGGLRMVFSDKYHIDTVSVQYDTLEPEYGSMAGGGTVDYLAIEKTPSGDRLYKIDMDTYDIVILKEIKSGTRNLEF